MNIHIGQTVESQTELRMLSASKFKIISAQGSKPNVKIVQDSLLGAYRMSFGIQPVRKDHFYNICLILELSMERIHKKMQMIRRVFKEKGKKAQCFHGKGLISLILPDDFYYEKKNNAHPDEPTVKIYKGVLYEGTFDKNILGSVSNSIIQIINKEYGPDEATVFVDRIQFVTNAWLLITGFSIGLGDCMIVDPEQVQKINDVIQKCYIEAEGVKTTTTHPGIREVRILAALNKAKDVGLRIAKESLSPDNNFLSTVKSGSKGDYFNISQVTGLLGQQNILGQRVKPTLNNGKRTLVHYNFDNLPLEMEYESRGFVASSFIKGVNPREFFFHSMSGREGVCDTAMNTSTSGYIQRKIVKLTEDIKIQYDGTVRDDTGSIYQFAYGDDNINPKETIKMGACQEPFDVSSLINKLNMKYEKK